MNNTVYNIENMTCAACAQRVERIIKKQDGVSAVTVNLATEKATVTYDPQTFNGAALSKAVENAGFKAIKAEKTTPTDEDKLRKEKDLTQQQLANHLGIDRSTYAYYESGRSKLSIDVVVKLAHFYKVSYAALLGPEPLSADS